MKYYDEWCRLETAAQQSEQRMRQYRHHQWLICATETEGTATPRPHDFCQICHRAVVAATIPQCDWPAAEYLPCTPTHSNPPSTMQHQYSIKY